MSPKCFISYSWDDASHKAWVRVFAERLRTDGVDIRLDQWDLHPGADFLHFMESAIRESDYVLLICTPAFAERANARRGGVGYEKSIVTGEIFEQSAATGKYVPILRKGTPSDSLPSYLKSRIFLDFRKTSMFDQAVEQLLRHIYQVPVHSPPPIGKPPKFTTPLTQSRVGRGRNAVSISSPIFRELFDFAWSTGGLNLQTRKGCMQWAKEWATNHGDIDFTKFKELFDFAWSTEGLNLQTKEECMQWATRELSESA